MTSAQDFLKDYLSETACQSFWGAGRDDERINAKTLAQISVLIQRHLSGCDGDKVPKYIYADSLLSCRIFNTRYFERLNLSAFEFLIKRVLV